MEKYIKGIFASRKESQFGEYIYIGITDEGIEALKNLPKTVSGFHNFTLTPQKEDKNKFSARPVVPRTDADKQTGDLPF